MFSVFYYACSPFRDDASSAPLHLEKKKKSRQEGEKEREFALALGNMMNSRLNAITL